MDSKLTGKQRQALRNQLERELIRSKRPRMDPQPAPPLNPRFPDMVTLGELQVGDRFRLHTPETGDDCGGTGVLLRKGTGSADVKLDRDTKEVVFRETSGAIRTFPAKTTQVTQWSLGTFVHKLGRDERVANKLVRPAITNAKQESEDAMQDNKEKSTMSTSTPTTKTKTATKATVKPPVKQATADKAANGKPAIQAVVKAAPASPASKPVAVPTPKAAPKAAAKPAPESKLNPCGCGCGEQVKRAFKQGHDARYYGWLKKVGDGRMQFQELPKSVQASLKDLSGAKKALAAHLANHK